MCFVSNLQVTYGAPTYRLSLLKRTFSLIKLHVIGLIKTKFKLFSVFKSVQTALRVSCTAGWAYFMPTQLGQISCLRPLHCLSFPVSLLFVRGFMFKI